MSEISLDEMLNNARNDASHAAIDASKGKISKPIKGVAKPIKDTIKQTEPDPEFAPPISYRTPKTQKKDPEDNVIENITPIKPVEGPVKMNIENAKPFDPATLPKKPTPPSEMDNEMMGALDKAIEREKESISKRVDDLTEAQFRELQEMRDREALSGVTPPDLSIDNDENTYAESSSENPLNFDDANEDTSDEVYTGEVIDDVASSNVEVDTPSNDNDDTVNLDFIEDDEDLEQDIERELNKTNSPEELSKEEQTTLLNELSSAVRSNIITIKKKIDFNDFKVADTPMAASKAISFSIKDINRADWILPNAKCIASYSGLSGPEIFALNPEGSNRSKLNTFKDIYKIIYKHIISPKPKTVEEWLKSTRYADLDHIYFGLHRATFKDSNFVHYECPNKHVYIEDKTFDSMVVFKDKEAEKICKDIITSSNTTSTEENIIRYQISDKYVVDIKQPSIWNTVIEMASLSDAFLVKYEDLLDTVVSIDRIYVIDYENSTLLPVDTAPDSKDLVKTIARKINTFAGIIRTMPSDNYFELRAQVNKAFENDNTISYQIPPSKCPKCGHEFKAQPMGGVEILFTRHQLGALGVI